MQFKCCLSSVAKFKYMLGGTVLADLIAWYCTVALIHHHYKKLYTKRETWVSVLLAERKTILLPIQLYSKLLIYYYKLHVSISVMQEAGDWNLQQLWPLLKPIVLTIHGIFNKLGWELQYDIMCWTLSRYWTGHCEIFTFPINTMLWTKNKSYHCNSNKPVSVHIPFAVTFIRLYKQVGSNTIFVVFLRPSRTVHESITYIQIKSSITLSPPNGPKQSTFCTFTWWWKQRQFQSTIYSNQYTYISSNMLLLATTKSELADSITS